MTISPMTALEALTALHHGTGAAVAFARRGPDGWEECGGCLAADLPARWPTLESPLSHDAYFTLASTYQQNRVSKTSAMGLPLWSRRTERLRWLNCVAVDIDRHGEKRFSIEPLLNDFWRELELQNLPLPTFLSFSGRGLWALWQIAYHNNRSQPVPAFDDKRALTQRIAGELVKRFVTLGADRHVTDSARLMRLPDSVNSKSTPENSRVRFFRASATTYTLPELADALAVHPRKVSLPGETRQKDRAKQAAGALRWRYPLEGFEQLWKIRGVFGPGTRRPAIYLYAMLLRKNHATPQQILTACTRLAESLTPALSVADVKRAILASERATRYNFSNSRLAEMLRITARERAALPRWFRPQPKHKSAQIAERRALVAQERSVVGGPLSTRQLARLLAEKHGIAVSRFTLARDLRSVGGAFPLLIEPRLTLCISRKNAPF